jgi:subtilisin family serine protease
MPAGRRFILRALLLGCSAAAAAPLQEATRIPNDPYFREQVSLYAKGGRGSLLRNATRALRDTATIAPGVTLDAPRAWALTTGSRDVVVAVLDDGFFYRHEDIADNVWHNPGETGTDANGLARETNGVDDDVNGLVDDVVGWDFAFNDPDPDHYVFDGMDRSRIQPYWHSISALGIIGARGGNGVGVAGINWVVSLMLLKIGAQGTRRGEADTARVGRAAQAIRYAVDNGARVIAAIGVNFTTGLRNGAEIYAVGGGTSDAGPVVAGVAALMLSVSPTLTAAELKAALIASATALEQLKGKVAGGGAVNAYHAVRLAMTQR